MQPTSADTSDPEVNEPEATASSTPTLKEAREMMLGIRAFLEHNGGTYDKYYKLHADVERLSQKALRGIHGCIFKKIVNVHILSIKLSFSLCFTSDFVASV